MESKIIFLFISNHLKSVETHLSCFKKDKTHEHLHNLRVDIKKAKAIFSFIKKVHQKNLEFDSLKPLYKEAGEIREIQLNITLFSLLPVPPQNIIVQLKEKQNSLEQKFIKHIPQFLRHVRKFRKETFFSFPLPDEQVFQKYLNNIRKKAEKCFNSQDRLKMHRFRKLVKKIMYVYLLLPKKYQKTIKFNIKLINKLQNEVGIWHDTSSAITFLSQMNFEQKDTYISTLKQQESKQFDNLFINNPSLKI